MGEREERDERKRREEREIEEIREREGREFMDKRSHCEEASEYFALILHKFSAERKKNLAKRSERVLLVFKY